MSSSICFFSSRPLELIKCDEKNYIITGTSFYQAVKRKNGDRFNSGRTTVQLNRSGQHDGGDITLGIRRNSYWHFSFSNISFQEYTREYNSSGWLLRKIAALPDSLLALASFVYHIVCLPFNFISSSFLMMFEPFPIEEIREKYVVGKVIVSSFNLVRDLEMIFGSLLKIFYDKGGSYFVEDSLFHKELYACKLYSVRC